MTRLIKGFETERLYIRPVQEVDKDEYMALRIQTSEISRAYTAMPDFSESEWESELNGNEKEIYYSVFLKQENSFVASASVIENKKKILEIGYDVKEEFRNRGVATELLKALLKEIRMIDPYTTVQIKTNADNKASRKVAEACGGVMTKFEDTCFVRAIKSLRNIESTGEEDEETRKLVEQGTNAVCVYVMP